MSEIRLAAENRTEFGKGASRRARVAGKVPAVLYGHHSEPRHLLFSALDFARAVKGDANTVLTLEIDGKDQLALPRAIVRHPLRDYLEHIDLLIVKRGERVRVEVPVHLTGSAAPGTLVLHDLTTIAIEVDALAIPENIEVSIEGAPAGSLITAGDIALPEGASLAESDDTLIVAIQTAPTAQETDEETDEAEVEVGASDAAPAEED